MNTKVLNNILAITGMLCGFALISMFFVKSAEDTKISSMQATMATVQADKFNALQEDRTILAVQSQQPQQQQPEEKKLGIIKLYLPKDASVFINNKATYSTGPYRIFDSELVVGKNYKFKVVVSYASGISEARDITLTGGEEVVLNFSE